MDIVFFIVCKIYFLLVLLELDSVSNRGFFRAVITMHSSCLV